MALYQQQDPASIQSLFNSIAKRYDRSNALLSFGLHRYWNRQLVRQVLLTTKPHALLDLCAGTGDIAFDYLKQSKSPCEAYLVDFSSEMLACAKAKGDILFPNQKSIHYIEADALKLPLQNESMDCATIAYGIRNVQSPSKCMEEVYRVLRPGGRFGILELTRPQNPFLHFAYRIYMKTLLPLIGKRIATNEDAYLYLMRTIEAFIPPSELVKMMQANGYQNVKCKPLIGGIATLIIGHKK